MVYQWTDGAHIKADAQKVGEQIDRIRTRTNGQITPEMLVHAGVAKSTPLHKCFEWDDGKAAHAFRIEQAKYVLRSIKVVSAHERATEPVRAFVSVSSDNDEGRTYRHVTDVMENPVLREQVVATALRELQAWRHKYAGLKELAALFTAIDEQTALELVA